LPAKAMLGMSSLASQLLQVLCTTYLVGAGLLAMVMLGMPSLASQLLQVLCTTYLVGAGLPAKAVSWAQTYSALHSARQLSSIRLEKPHSLSYQASTLSSLPLDLVWLASKIDDSGL
jgi:hypothetical protein